MLIMNYKLFLLIGVLSALIVVAGCGVAPGKGMSNFAGLAVAGYSDGGCVDGEWWYEDGSSKLQGPFNGCTDFTDNAWCATKTVTKNGKKVYVAGGKSGTTWQYCEPTSKNLELECFAFGVADKQKGFAEIKSYNSFKEICIKYGYSFPVTGLSVVNSDVYNDSKCIDLKYQNTVTNHFNLENFDEIKAGFDFFSAGCVQDGLYYYSSTKHLSLTCCKFK